jgi:uncharacterized membrane protein YdjX (TVP38/TMEM64 family)
VSRLILKLSFAAIAVITLAFVVHYLPVLRAVRESCRWIGGLGLPGVGLLTVFLAVGSLCFLPASPFIIAAAAVFGFWLGLLTGIIGVALGASGGFMIGRIFLRKDVARQLRKHPTFRAMDIAIEKEGWKIVALLRLCPIPFGLANYLYGLTGVPFSQYLLTSIIGSLPGVLLFSQLGSAGKASLDALSSGNFGDKSGTLILLALSLVASVTLIFFLPRFARRAVAKYANVSVP